jgi:elongation factor 3
VNKMAAFDVTDLLSKLSIGDNWKKLPALGATLAASLAKSGKGDVAEVVAALNSIENFAKSDMITAEAMLCTLLPGILAQAGNKQKPCREAANAACDAVVSGMGANCVREVIQYCFVAMTMENNYLTRVLALNIIAKFGDTCAVQLGTALPEVVPEVTPCMTDVKKEVAQAAIAAMSASCDVIGNRDIEHMTGNILRSITHPKEVPEIMHALAGVTFVQSVQSPALAMVTPLLVRGLKSSVTATRRQSAVIIDNMSKLVDDPLDAAPFLPRLVPALASTAETMSDPEARGVCERASNQLNKLEAQVKSLVTEGIQPALVLAALKEAIGATPSEADLFLEHTMQLICSHMGCKSYEDWEDVKSQLDIITKKSVAVIETMIPACKHMMSVQAANDDDGDDAEVLCNCLFTLAYGTKILLHNTTMKLKRGAKYGLLGGNDSGKTTLMRSIANGSVEGFPDPADVKTVFVEADILGEL